MELCKIKHQKKTISKAHAQRSPAEADAYRKMMQKKTIRTASPKIVRPVYTKPKRPPDYVPTRTQKRIKAKRICNLERAPYPDDIEYYKRPKEHLRPRKHGPFIIDTPKPKWNDAIHIVVNQQLLSRGIPYRLPPSFNLSCMYEGKKFTLGTTARELILKHLDRKTPQYVRDLQGRAQKILLLKNHPENDVLHVRSRSQRWSTNHRTKMNHYACMADVQHIEDNNVPVDQPPTTSEPVIILEPMPARDPPTPKLDNITGANNITNDGTSRWKMQSGPTKMKRTHRL
jgi:hypothetical protein